MFENDTNYRESWVLTNKTNQRFSIGDLNTLPCLEPNKSLDLLKYCNKEQISNSAQLSAMVKRGLVTIDKKYKSDVVPVPTTPSNIDEAITPAEHDLSTGGGSVTKQAIIDTGITLNEIDGVLTIVKGGTNNTNYIQNKFLIYDGTSIEASLYDQNSFLSLVTADSPLSGSGTPGSHLTISSVDSTHVGVVPLSGTPLTNQYLRSTHTTGVVAWEQIAYADISGTPTPTLASVTASGALTTTSIQLQNALAVELGKDDAVNTAGSIKFWGAGANNYYTTFTTTTQSGNADYTLPVGFPASTAFMKSTSGGALSWDINTYLKVDGGADNWDHF